MRLRKGKTKSILENSIDAALLGVEIYNKPRTSFRSQSFISLMIIAWTRLYHAHFNRTIGDKYFYKDKKGSRYVRVDGERKAWDLRTCIRKYGKLSEAEKANLEFFIKLRNKIEHRGLEKSELDTLIFGECQALLFNYENTLIRLFGEQYALHENLVFSLQFSAMRTSEQISASKRALSAELKHIKGFIEKYRSELSDEVFNDQTYSVKLIQVPKISNTNRNDLAIEFVRWDSLSEKDRQAYSKITAIIKDKVVKKEAINVGRLKPGQVLAKVAEKCGLKMSHHDHKCLYVIFGVRPPPSSSQDPFDTDTRFCHYDEVHDDYVYKEEWVNTIVSLLRGGKMKKWHWTQAYKRGRKHVLEDYLPNEGDGVQ